MVVTPGFSDGDGTGEGVPAVTPTMSLKTPSAEPGAPAGGVGAGGSGLPGHRALALRDAAAVEPLRDRRDGRGVDGGDERGARSGRRPLVRRGRRRPAGLRLPGPDFLAGPGERAG